MATAKKTPVAAKKAAPVKSVVLVAAKKAAPVAAKKAVPVAAKTVAAKKAAPAVKTVKFKVGQELIGTAANGNETRGRFVKYREERGQWVDINIAPKGKPSQIKGYRPKAVRAA